MNTLENIAVLADTYKDFFERDMQIQSDDARKVYNLLLEVAALPHSYREGFRQWANEKRGFDFNPYSVKYEVPRTREASYALWEEYKKTYPVLDHPTENPFWADEEVA